MRGPAYRAVLFPPQPEPGESLMGLVTRAAADNMHGTTGYVLAGSAMPHHAAFDMAAAFPDRVDDVATALGLDPSQIQDMFHPTIPLRRKVDGVDFHGAIIPRYDLDFRSRRISPTALRRAPYHRAIWHHKLIPFCPETGDLLIGHCPRCGCKLSWGKTRGVHVCESCDLDLREVQPSPVSEERREQATLMIGLVNPDQEARAKAITTLSPKLRCMNPGALFDLGWHLACGIRQDRYATKRHLHGISVEAEEAISILSEASSLLSEWPANLTAALNDGFARRGPDHFDKAVSYIRQVGNTKFSRQELQIALRDALPELGSRQRMLRSVVDGKHTAESASARLGFTARDFAFLRRAGGIEATFAGGAARLNGVFDSQALEELASRTGDRMRAGSAAERAGIPVSGLEQFCCAGELEWLDDAHFRMLRPELHVRGASFNDLLRRLEARSEAGGPRPDDVLLRRALFVVGGREKPYGPIMRALLDGTIPFRIVRGDEPLFRRILIAEGDVAGLGSFTFSRGDHPQFPFASDMTRRDAESVLNLAPGAMARALKEDLREAVSCGTRLDRHAVSLLAANRISGGEILRRFGKAGKIRTKSFRKLGPAGWCRLEIESFFGAC